MCIMDCVLIAQVAGELERKSAAVSIGDQHMTNEVQFWNVH